MSSPTEIGRPREILETIRYGVPIRCPHCRAVVAELLIVDDGVQAGSALACDERAKGRRS